MINHLCLGSVFAWSIFNQPLTRLHGFLVPASADWTLGDVSITFSLVMAGFAWGAFLSKYLERFGPRFCCLVGASSLGSGFLLSSFAINTHSLGLLYTAGLVWGLANGWAYVPPVATLIKWFPKRKGLASGLCIMGFGAGAAIASPAFSYLLKSFQRIPDYVGSVDAVNIINKGGQLFINTGDELREVIVATAKDVAPYGVPEGVYLVGTGSTGAAETFATLGITYSIVMAVGAYMYRTPSSVVGSSSSTIPTSSVYDPKVNSWTATTSPQFGLMWSGFALYATGVYGLISCGATIVTEVFGTTLPNLVTAGCVATFVSGMSIANLSGRLGWGSVSDMLAYRVGGNPFFGRRLSFTCMWAIGPPLFLIIPWSIHQCVESSSPIYFWIFTGSVMGLLSSFGGMTATRPPMMDDLFGQKNTGILTARGLSSVLPAAFLGPKIATFLRERAVTNSILDLSTQVSESNFVDAFGVGKNQLDDLIANKTVTINRLMELVPVETIDPTPFVYDETMYVMAGFSTLALLTNQFVSPMSSVGSPKKLHVTEQTKE